MARWETHRTDANAEELYDAARKLGMSVAIVNRPIDAVVGCYGLTVAIEVKTPKSKPRRDRQQSQQQFLREFRGALQVWRTVHDVQATHDELRLQAIRLAVP